MNVLITGAGGFLGSAAVRVFVEAGHDVRAHLGAPGDAVFAPPLGVEGSYADITDVSAFAPLIRGVDTCVHLAGPASVAASFLEPQSFARAHVVGTANVLDAATRYGVERVVYVSSAEVYGRAGSEPVQEDRPLAPRSPYGAAKVGAEAMMTAAIRRGALPSGAILRPFSIFGPKQREDSLLGTILRQAMFESALVLDDLLPERDYCFVDDVARALLAASTAKFDGVTIANIGSGRAVSVGEIAREAIAATGRNIPVRERGATRPAKAEIFRLVADVARARKLYQWNAEVSLQEGLRRCVDATATI